VNAATRTVCFVSDRTGVTAEALGHALLSLFAGMSFDAYTMPFVLDVAQARGVVARINALGAEQNSQPIVFCTVVEQETRAVIKQAQALVIDMFSFVAALEAELGVRAGAAGAPARGLPLRDPRSPLPQRPEPAPRR
jgi:regulator of PEP synthase PpsR (kinase-PPPase family)